ncbi:hypothetical protein OE88DRAFT_1646394 [Heliocybe sulcata]|uniref:3-hydroxy-3-methylglutaryl coenzyme A reductase n=1 Tax=Heliocybe sulcata TaxID=5364 RepID=A0A5C3N6G3_9AGAM|nr:hypothetical protein OE88DRAFT_1646394 [Heliocybe sulcata]
MRALSRPLARNAVSFPIETIVFFFVATTLAYFQLLSVIKHSAWLEPMSAPAVRPANVRIRQGEWDVVGESAWMAGTVDENAEAMELQQIVFSLDAPKPAAKPKKSYNSASMDSALLESSVNQLMSHLTHQFPALSGLEYPSLCYGSSPANRSSGSSACFTSVAVEPRSTVLTLSFLPGNRDEFVDALRRHAFDSDSNGVSFQVEEQHSENIGEMKSGKWVVYALRALVMRFWELARKADSLDILLVLSGYVLMHLTFIRLVLRSRALGSNFWLTTAVLSCAITSFILTLCICAYLRIPLDPVSLSEAMPFVVCTVGFEKPLRLAKAVFRNRYVTEPVDVPSPGSRSGMDTPALRSGMETPRTGQMKSASEVIMEAFDAVGNSILRDYALEVAVLCGGIWSGVGGLKEFCALAAVLLTVDCVVLSTFYVAVLGVMVEVLSPRGMIFWNFCPGFGGSGRSGWNHGRVDGMDACVVGTASDFPADALRRVYMGVRRIKRFRYIARTLAQQYARATKKRGSADDSDEVPLPITSANMTFGERVTATILGVKGSMLKQHQDMRPGQEAPKEDEESPVARLKLLLIVSFLTLHILNLCTTLAPATAAARYNNRVYGDQYIPAVRKVDVTSPVISKVLSDLAVAHAIPVTNESAALEFEKDLLVKVAPPVYVRIVPPTITRGASAKVEQFLESWTGVVADPILSKWLVAILAVSIALNGFLLKGLAFTSGSTSAQPPFMSASAAAIISPIPERLGGMPLDLDDIDRKLEKSKEKEEPVPAPPPAPVSTESSEPSSPSEQDKDIVKKVSQVDTTTVRSLQECVDIYENGPRPVTVSMSLLNDEEVIQLCQGGKIAAYALEKVLGDLERAVLIRRALISRASKTKTFENSLVPMRDYDYSKVIGACCENVVGYIPLPLGIAGPLKIDGELYPIPMATAEGTLVASTSRGAKALNAGGGVTTVLTYDSMTRGPAIDFPSITECARAKRWIDSDEGNAILKEAFESTSRFAKLQRLKCAMAGRTLYVRFATSTGDAMGMNMISKGTEKALEVLQKEFPDMVVLALSGNYCTDKKPAAINWIEGRGKSVVAEAVIPGKIVKTVLKTTVESLCNVNVKKNLIGSAMAGSIGGFNAHAANILTAIFLATGQDPAQNVESSMCMTLMEPTNNGQDLLMTVSMPCIEVGTVGGGTVLPPQAAVLDMLGIRGAHPTEPGKNAQRLARTIAAAVMAGELSLMSALAAGHLVRAHMAHNRSQANTTANTPLPSRPVTPGPMGPAGGSFWSTGSKQNPGRGILSPLALTRAQSTDTTAAPGYNLGSMAKS